MIILIRQIYIKSDLYSMRIFILNIYMTIYIEYLIYIYTWQKRLQ